MRILVFFDLPVKTKRERKEATRFRSFLLKDGYYMVQYSVYSRICNGYEMVCTHENRINANLPPNGSVRMLIITEKQFDAIKILVGSQTYNDTPQAGEQISFF